MRHRSWLYIPASNARALKKGTALSPDAFIFDLEDAVASKDKPLARQILADFLTLYQGRNVWLRVNHPSSSFFADDMAFAAAHGITQIVLPKTETIKDIEAVSSAAMEIIASIETPKGVLEAKAIAAHPQVNAVVAGLNDLAFALQRKDDALTSILDTIQITAKAYGKLALDGVYNHYRDIDGFTRHAQRGHRLGFDGKTLIHPSQIAITHSIYRPDEAEYLAAKALLAQVQPNGGAIGVDGRMIEDMHIERARQVVEIFEASHHSPLP